MSNNVFPMKDVSTRDGQSEISESILRLGNKLVPNIPQLTVIEQYALDSATQAYLAKKDRERAESSAQFITITANEVSDIKDSLLQMYDEGISNGNIVAPVVDNTLTESGKAADSKEVGNTNSFILNRINDLVVQRKNRLDYLSYRRVEGKRFVNYYVDDENFTVSDWIYIGDLREFYVAFIAVVAWGDVNRRPLRCIELNKWSLQISKIIVPSDAKYVKLSYQTSYKERAKLGTNFSDVNDVVDYNEYSLSRLNLVPRNFNDVLVNQTFDSVEVNGNQSVNAGTLNSDSLPKLYSVFVSDGENVIVTIDLNKNVWVRNLSSENLTVDVSINYIP